MPKETIKIGTRKSKLALWQAYYVQHKLEEVGWPTELVTMETKGDKVLDVSIAKIGSKGVFTEELEDKLADGSIDIAVHSAKDMQSSLPEGFEIIAFSKREKVEDVIVGDRPIDLSQPTVLGTSSTRRMATLSYFYPKIRTVEVRGNLQTRIQKMRDGLCDGLLLAYAGVHRMEYDHMIKHILSVDEFIPAVGQGSIAIEAHGSLSLEKKEVIRQAINDGEAWQCLSAERAYLKKLEGGCSIPVFALARRINNQVEIVGGIISLDGKERIVKSDKGDNPQLLGEKLADEVLKTGGDRILKQIKAQMG